MNKFSFNEASSSFLSPPLLKFYKERNQPKNPYSAALMATVLLFLSVDNVIAQQQTIRYVPDVVSQFNSLSIHPEAMGFELYGPDPSQCRHHQALNRTEAADGTPYFLVTRSGPPRDDCLEEIIGIEGNPIANLYIVRMGSRDKNGERLRSNRLRRGLRTTLTPPDPEDKVVRSISYDGPTLESDFPHYDHPGGMQQVGNIVAIGVEFPPLIPNPDLLPPFIPDPDYPPVFVQFLDVSDPEHPQVTSRFVPAEDGAKAGVVALTPCGSGRVNVPCATGHYLLAISGGSDNGTVHFYESATTATDGSNDTDLSSSELTWNLMDTWTRDEVIDGEWHAHQTLQFLREGDLGGELYLAGARGGRALIGSVPDVIDLYRMNFDGNQVRIRQVSSRHLNSHPAAEGESVSADVANFAAASTFYVSPSGELIFYAAEHDNDGPDGTNGRGSVKMGEWRHVDMARPNSPTFLPAVKAGGPYTVDEGSSVILEATSGPPITKAFIQLYADENYANRNIVIDYDDWEKDDFDDFKNLDPGFFNDVNGASDEATSWRWFAPMGCTIRANDDDFGDSDFPGSGTKTLPGLGEPRRDPDLHNVANDANDGDVNDSFTSAQFFPDCQNYYGAALNVTWDLDGNGSYEAVGTQVAFNAAAVDGPGIVQVSAQAQHPVGGLPGIASTTVNIRNVAPQLSLFRVTDSAGNIVNIDVPFVLTGVPVSVNADFTDPGVFDHQTAKLDWGDGSTDLHTAFATFDDAFGDGAGAAMQTHRYVNAGSYLVELNVKDDDNGESTVTANVRVETPAQSVSEVIELLDGEIADTSNKIIREILKKARKALVGSPPNSGNNGALAKIEAGNNQSAIAFLEEAIGWLKAALAGGADVNLLIVLLEQVIVALSTP